MIDISLHVLVGGNWIRSDLQEEKKEEIRQIQVTLTVWEFFFITACVNIIG